MQWEQDLRTEPVSLCELDGGVQDIDAPYLVFVFGKFSLEIVSTDCTKATTDVTREPKLHIPYVVFHYDSAAYLFVQKGRFDGKPEDNVASFLEHVGDLIHAGSNHKKSTWNRIRVYEV